LNIEQIFQSLQKGKISPSRAKKLLSLYSIEKIGNIAQIDTGRRNRKGIPEVIFAERKHLLDLKKIIKKTLSKNNEVLVSRIKQKDYTKILEFAKKNKYKIKKGKNTTALLIYKKNIFTSITMSRFNHNFFVFSSELINCINAARKNCCRH